MTSQCVSSAIVWVARVVHHTEASATMAPTERSMPPPVITNVMPMLTTPMTEASRRIVRRLAVLANWSPAVATPATQSRASATTSPRLRPAPLCSSAAGPESRVVSAAAFSTRAVSPGTSAVLLGVCSVMPLFLP